MKPKTSCDYAIHIFTDKSFSSWFYFVIYFVSGYYWLKLYYAVEKCQYIFAIMLLLFTLECKSWTSFEKTRIPFTCDCFVWILQGYCLMVLEKRWKFLFCISIYTKSFVVIREINALLLESCVFIRESYALFCEDFELFPKVSRYFANIYTCISKTLRKWANWVLQKQLLPYLTNKNLNLSRTALSMI